MRFLTLLFAFLLAVTAADAQKSFQPVNPNATPEAKQLLEFLYSINGEYTLTGQHNFASALSRYDDYVFDVTGKRPVVWGCDFSFNAIGKDTWMYQHCGPMNLTPPTDPCAFNGQTTEESRQGMIDEAIRQYKLGRIITLMWHSCFPTECDDCDGETIWTWEEGLPDMETWEELLTEGTSLNNAWKRQMDGVVPYFKQLQDARVPVLWRPYHEMNGVWFWWCDKPGDWGFKRLWVMMYDYLTNHHKINNLIWVWNTNAPRDIPGDEAGPYKYFYPGTDYVDILSSDVYRRDYKRSHHDDLLTLGKGKLISLGEVGELPAPGTYAAQNYWSWFMVWGQCIVQWNDVVNIRNIYNHPRSITLDQIELTPQGYKLKAK